MISKEDIGTEVGKFIYDTYGSQTEAGRILGMHSSTLSGIVHGRWLPNERILAAMKMKRVDVKDADGRKINTYYEEDDHVKQSKFNRLHRGLTAMAKKVYDCVPADKALTLHQIVTEMGKTGSTQFAVVEACLKQMSEAGLVKRNGDNYIRESVEIELPPTEKEIPAQLPKVDDVTVLINSITNPDIPKPPEEKPMVTPIAQITESPFIPDPVKPKTPLDIMAELSERANKNFHTMQEALIQVQRVMNDFEKLSTDIEHAAIAIQEKFEADAAELTELRELKSTLKKFIG